MAPSSTPIYLDHSATTPLRAEVREAMMPYLGERFGNAGSIHRFGRIARKAVDDARDQVAALIHADPRDIVFTSGGTESDNLALRGIATASKQDRKRIVVSAVEHHAVLHAAEYLAKHDGVDLCVVGVDETGLVDPEAVCDQIDDATVLVSVMHANNETGVIQPIQTIGAACRERGVPFHSDTVQSVGKLALDVETMPIDLLAISAHKIYGPKGVGAFYARRDIAFEPQAVGGAQERGKRAGTENVAGIVGLGKACELARLERETEMKRLTALREGLETALLTAIADARINGPRKGRLPHVLNIRFPGVEGESLLLALDMEGIAVSTGSACTSGSLDPSHVLLAMGLSHEDAQSAIRISLGRDTTQSEIDRVATLIPDLVQRLRSVSPLTPLQ